MTIDFDSMEWKANPEFKGGTGVFYNKMVMDGPARIMLGRLTPGSSIGYHKHEGESESVYIISGYGSELADDSKVDVKPGECHVCQEGHSHSLINDREEGDLIFFAVIK